MIVVVTSLILLGGLIEWYVLAAFKKRWFGWSNVLRKITKIGFWFLLGISLFSLIMMFAFNGFYTRAVLNFWFSFFVWNLAVKGTLALFLIIDDIRRLGIFTRNRIKKTIPEQDGISRSDFLLKSGLAAATVPMFGLSWGMIAGPYRYKVFKEKVNLPHLPESFEGLKIVQISDIHAGSFYDRNAVQRGVDLIMEQNADVIFFTGDLVNDRAEEMEPWVDLFKQIKAPMGVYSVLGNHDYGEYENWESEAEKDENDRQLREMHQRLGWKLLLNDHVYLERGADNIAVLGVENWGKDFIQKADLNQACNGCEAPVKLLLSHDPTHFDEVIKKDHPEIDITFSGHTHGAQMGIETGGFKWSPISLRYSKWAGLYEENGQYLYINRGYGFIGYAGRLGIMPEVTVMELHKGDRAV